MAAPASLVTLSGSVTTSALANLRSGMPNRSSPVARKLAPNTLVSLSSLVIGETVDGNPNWYQTTDGFFLWSGACTNVSDAVADSRSSLFDLTKPPRVADMSHLDGLISFDAAKAAGLKAVIHKATTGGTGRDDAFKDRRAKAKAAGLLWGAYHWGTAADVDAQIANFWDWATPAADELIAIDFEPTVDNQMTLDQLRAFCQKIQAVHQRSVVIYGGSFLKEQLGGGADANLAQHRLWLAQYGPTPVIPAAWQSFWLWQYTDGEAGALGCAKTVPGLPGDSKGRLDCDYYRGTDQELVAQWADG